MQKESLTILVENSVHNIAHNQLKELGTVHSIDLQKTDASLLAQAHILVIRAHTLIDKEFLDKAPNLKILATATTGVDHIDLTYAAQKNIAVLTADGKNANAVGDYILRMLIQATDDVFYTNNLLKRSPNEFMKIKQENKRSELAGKFLGLIGFGNTGKAVAKRAEAFGMLIKKYDPFNDEAKDSLEEVLACDVVSLHLWLTKDTHHMIGKEQLALMKPTAILINAARGGLIEEKALLETLKQNKIRLAILDVFENEPSYSELYELDNAICTPHIAGNSEEALKRCGEDVVNKVKEEIKKL